MWREKYYWVFIDTRQTENVVISLKTKHKTDIQYLIQRSNKSLQRYFWYFYIYLDKTKKTNNKGIKMNFLPNENKYSFAA